MFLAAWPLAGRAADAAPSRRWAEQLPNPHLKNFHKVSDDLYRGAQPSPVGMKELEGLGIKTIINLRGWHSDVAALKGTSLRYEHIEMSAALPRNKEVIRFIQIVGKKENGPFFVHCQHGSDRTGTMCAVYRMAFQGWNKNDAIEEMTQGGFGFHKIWNTTLVPWLHKTDIGALKGIAGVQ
jgi:protein tyrosine/serine phosphatase